MEYTENYSLKKPTAADFYNVEDFNENADAIDEKLYVGEQAYTLVSQLATRVQTLESENSELKQKAKIALDVYAPQGAVVSVLADGVTDKAHAMFVMGADEDMCHRVELPEIGEWVLKCNYGGAVYSLTVNVSAPGVTKVALAPTLEASPWAFIDRVSVAGLADTCWAVGDVKVITITGEGEMGVRILGFDHDLLEEPGKGHGARAGITFALAAPLSTPVQLHSTTTVTDWEARDIVTTTLPEKLLDLPGELQEVIKTVGKICLHPDTEGSSINGADARYGAQMLAAQLFLLSERDIFGESRLSSPYYGLEEQYEYYKRGNDFKQEVQYWLRSLPYTAASSGKYGISVKTDGSEMYSSQTDRYALLYGFCV